MSRSHRLKLQIKQIKTILEDFTKVRKKCANLSQELDEDFPKQKLYQQLEREIELKMNILDHAGLVTLKNKLVQAYTDLLQLQHQLNYCKQRKSLKKQLHNTDGQDYLKLADNQFFQSFSPAKYNDNKKKTRENQLPFYVIRPDNAQNKLDSIAKFLASLKKSMKIQSQGAQHLRTKDYLLSQPYYQKLQQQLERYKMRQQQLRIIFERKVKEQVQKYLTNNCEVIDQNPFYKTYRVYKQKSQKNIQPETTKSEGEQQQDKHAIKKDYKLLDSLGITQMNVENKVDFNAIRRKVNDDFEDIKKSIEQKSNNLVGIFQKISETVTLGEGRLQQLRGKRKKMFVDDDIWEQIQKV